MGSILVAIDPGKSAGLAVFRDRELVRVLAVDGDDPPLVGGCDEIVCEIPHTGRGPMTLEDRAILCVRAGLLIGAVKRPGVGFRLVTPSDWKGQLPKKVSHARIRAKLAISESKLLLGMPLDCWDAVGIGLWALGR